MIAYNFNIDFASESELQNEMIDTKLETIRIVTTKESMSFDDTAHCSEWILMSGREVRYFTENEFTSSLDYGCKWTLVVKDVVSFTWLLGCKTIHYRQHAKYSSLLLQFWVLHTLLPLFFSLEKRYEILHVGAVEITGHPVLFSAESFGGKSTLTDYFIRQGHTMLSDDALGVYRCDDTFYAVASYPFHRPYRKFEDLGYQVSNISNQPKPIRGVYLLAKSDEKSDVAITEVKGIEKFKAFHFSKFVNFYFYRQHYFQILTEMSNLIPVYNVIVPWNLERLHEVYCKIVSHSSETQENK